MEGIYPAMNAVIAIMTTRYACWCNSGMDVTGVPTTFCRRKYAYYKSDQEFMAGELRGLTDEHTTNILLNGLSIKLSIEMFTISISIG